MAGRQGVATATGGPLPSDPLRSIWKLLTNVKFALAVVGVIAVACLLGVVFPQLPQEMRDNPAARSAWFAAQEATYGPATPFMQRAQLFEVFYSWWFNALWVLILVAMTVCTVSRLRPVARNVHTPRRRVPDRYFETAHHRASIPVAVAPEAVEAALRKRRYKVERAEEANGATYLFADRFPWAQYGTFISHLALLLFLVGGVLTRFVGFDRTLIAAETGSPAPVFGEARADQIFVGMDDAIRRIDDNGNIIDFRSHLSVQQGDEVITCTTTVNDPCHAFGYSIHQAAFIDDLARLRIVDPEGRPLYDDLVDFREEKIGVPHMRVTDANGAVLFDQVLPQMASDRSEGGAPVALANLVFRAAPGAEEQLNYGVAWSVVNEALVLTVGGRGLPLEELTAGESAETDSGYTISYVEAVSIPGITLLGMPGATDAEDGTMTIQMPSDRQGNEYLFVSGIDNDNVALVEGQERTASTGYTFLFGGRAEASGLSVKRDPGDTFIWLAVGMATVGLAITFYVPRRRLWARITPDQLQFAGIAERTTRFDRELRLIGADLGGPPVESADD